MIRQHKKKQALALIKMSGNDYDYGAQDEYGRTALMYASANYWSEDIMYALIATGKSNPSAQDENGDTALMMACANETIENALALIKTGASNPGAQNIYGETALIYACRFSYYDENEIGLTFALIATGKSNPGAQDSNGYTALMYALYNNMIYTSFAIIATGEYNPEAENEDGHTALFYAYKCYKNYEQYKNAYTDRKYKIHEMINIVQCECAYSRRKAFILSLG
jgi:ankyrin repeat protein